MKYINGYMQKAASGEGREHDGIFVLNEETPDRVGDIIEAKGWVLDDFMKNPIALYSHDHEKPIGKWQDVHVKGKQLIGSLKLASTKLAQMVKTLIDEDILRAVSVGFRPLDYDPIDKDDPWGAWHIKSALLLEVSTVAVGAHPNALRISKDLGLNREERELVFGASSSAIQIDPDVREKATNPAVLRATKSLEAARNTLRIKS